MVPRKLSLSSFSLNKNQTIYTKKKLMRHQYTTSELVVFPDSLENLRHASAVIQVNL